jgi:8-oxo-dGTP pyrophosphatase MutT (NUDIX family)
MIGNRAPLVGTTPIGWRDDADRVAGRRRSGGGTTPIGWRGDADPAARRRASDGETMLFARQDDADPSPRTLGHVALTIADPAKLPVPLRRLGYRSAYAVLRVYWFLFRPTMNGVKCVLTDGDQVLLVRHTYGPRGWDLPGGSIKAGESEVGAAQREMCEELGVSVDGWRPLGQLDVVIDYRRDHIHCLQAELQSPPLKIDQGELRDAGWFRRTELPRVGRYTRQILSLIDNPSSPPPP